MSVRSMTGYGRGESRADGVRIEVEISSVNRKQLDVQFNLPRALQALESRIQDEVSHTLTRGRLALNVYFRPVKGAAHRVTVDEPLAAAYVKALRDTARKLGLKDRMDSSVLLAVPDLVRLEHLEEDVDRVWPALKTALTKALKQLHRMRTVEGRALEADVRRRAADIERRVNGIRLSAPAAAERYRAQLRQRIASAGLSPDQHSDRITREIVLFAERCDIAEEITRISSHLAQMRGLLKTSDAVGRTLDFITQELFREINTIGSKSNDAAIAAEVVACKAEIERIREQVQNIE